MKDLPRRDGGGQDVNVLKLMVTVANSGNLLKNTTNCSLKMGEFYSM